VADTLTTPGVASLQQYRFVTPPAHKARAPEVPANTVAPGTGLPKVSTTVMTRPSDTRFSRAVADVVAPATTVAEMVVAA
jgi:hypothetical protein